MNLAKEAIKDAVKHGDLSAWVQKQLALASVSKWAAAQDECVSRNKIVAEVQIAVDEINAHWSDV